MTSRLLLAAALLATSSPAFAQFNDAWAEFTPAPALLSAPTISDSTLETDLAWGDLDQNGLEDLVVARVQPIMAGGARTNMLLMNEAGVLTDRTATFATASDVAGDSGFLTPTSDRDVVVVDLNQDGWLDVVTAVGFGNVGDPMALSHPRVYINLGNDLAGNWQGLRYEQSRFPALINFVTGLQVAARFNAVAAGDVNGDGFVDLYFGDHDAAPSSPFGGESPNFDTDDRLFLNDGFGFFTDVTALSLMPAMTKSNFCNSAAIGDFNQDGVNDILKQTNASSGGAKVTVAYNDSATPGTFTSFQQAYSGSPYNISTGDLNGDGRLDVVVSENGKDGVLYNTATGVSGQVTWSPLIPFEFLTGGDDSFAANSLVTDLDGDGLNDVLIADVDPQVSGFNRRLHIYHNRGNAVTGAAILREERENATTSGWVGLVGLHESDMKGTHDIAVLDIDGDGLDDLVISRNAGTSVWRREPYCQPDLGMGAAGLAFEVCGDKLATGSSAVARLSGAAPGAPILVLAAGAANPTFVPVLQDTVVAFPPFYISGFAADASGELALSVPGGGGPFSWVGQCLVANGLPTLFSPSNAVLIEFLP